MCALKSTILFLHLACETRDMFLYDHDLNIYWHQIVKVVLLSLRSGAQSTVVTFMKQMCKVRLLIMLSKFVKFCIFRTIRRTVNEWVCFHRHQIIRCINQNKKVR